MTFWPPHMATPLLPLKHACHLNPESLSEKTEADFEIEYIDIGNVTLEKGIEAREIFRFADAPSRARKPIRNGDTIISTVRTYLKAIAFVHVASPNWIASTGFSVCRPKVGVNAKYLYHAIQSTPFVEAVVSASTGVSYPAITPSALGSLEVPLPSAETQKAIADFLDRETARIDQLIEKKRRMVELLENKRATLHTTLVLGGEEARDGNIAEWWLSFMPEHWQSKTLMQLVSFRGGATPSKDRPDFWTGDIPWVSPKDMKRDRIEDAEDHINEMALSASSVSKIPPGAVLIVTRGMILARAVPVALTNAVVTINQDMKALIPRSEISGEYLLCLLQGLETILLSFIEEAAHGTKKLRTERLFKTRFPIPPRAEQDYIASTIRELRVGSSKTISAIKASVGGLLEFRSALITAAVTGQLDVEAWGKRGTTDRRLDKIEADMAAAVPPERKLAMA